MNKLYKEQQSLIRLLFFFILKICIIKKNVVSLQGKRNCNIKEMSKDGFKISCTVSAFLSILTIIFVIGKVIGIINWSWWIVFLPTIIEFSLCCVVAITLFLLFVFFNKRF